MASKADVAELAEAIARLEYKQDLILEILKQGRFQHFAKLSAPRYCPVCNVPVRHQLGAVSQIVQRLCGCRTGIVPPPDLEALAPPQAAGSSRNASESVEVQGDGSDEVRGKGGKGRRAPR